MRVRSNRQSRRKKVQFSRVPCPHLSSGVGMLDGGAAFMATAEDLRGHGTRLSCRPPAESRLQTDNPILLAGVAGQLQPVVRRLHFSREYGKHILASLFPHDAPTIRAFV